MRTALRPRRAWRAIGFAALSAVCVAVPVTYVLRAMKPSVLASPLASVRPPEPATPLVPPPSPSPPVKERGTAARPASRLVAPARVVEPPSPPRRALFRYSGLGELHGRLVVGSLQGGDVTATPLRCERVHMAAGHGVCLEARRGVFTTYHAVLFGENFEARHRLSLTGVPSRTRVSPDGRRAAVTVFETGHSYSAAFSTRTSIIDLETGDLAVPTLEAFTVLRDDAEIRSPDFNIWGVTFARDTDRFYATLATGGQTYLVEGSVTARTLRILRSHVECPALSPDNRRLAFKKRLGGQLGPITWRLAVLDLASGEERELAETRHVDDQADWLDDSTVLYAIRAADAGTAALDTYVVPADGSGVPRLLVPNAYSLVALRR
jgi:hypothetical protein